MLILDDSAVFWVTIQNDFFVLKFIFSYKKKLLDANILGISKKNYVLYEITLKFGKKIIKTAKIGIFMSDNFFFENLKIYKSTLFKIVIKIIWETKS